MEINSLYAICIGKGVPNVCQMYDVEVPAEMHIQQVPMPISYGCNHGKVIILWYPDRIRVAITTSNLLKVDFERKTQVTLLPDPFSLSNRSKRGSG